MFKKKPKFFYKKSFISALLIPFSWIYFICFCIANIRLFKPKRVCKKTICVGNIVVGGSGKTPISIAIYKAFSKYYSSCCFITKGYGRKTKKPLILPCNHDLVFNASETGDEPILLSKYGDVFIVNKRSKADCHEYDLAICDDGYFDKSIYKDCQIVVFDSSFFVGNCRILPAGALRSWLKSLKKANFAIIANADENFENQVKFLEKGKYVVKEHILPAKLVVKSEHNKTKKYFAFSGIGENQKFLNSLKSYGINIVKFIGLNDHQEYSAKLLKKLTEEFVSSGADKMITTAKDYTKLSQEFCTKNDVEVFEIDYKIDGIEKIIEFVDNI